MRKTTAEDALNYFVARADVLGDAPGIVDSRQSVLANLIEAAQGGG